VSRAAHSTAILLPLSLLTACCWAQERGPQIGYLYPAGGRQGTTLRVTVGGQLLQDANEAYVSGDGVTASVVEYVRPLSDQDLGYAARFLYELVRRRWSARVMDAAAEQTGEMAILRDHPRFRDLADRSPQQIAELRAGLLDPKRQPNAQISEQVEIEVTIDPDAAPGNRELRLWTARGLTNPWRFQVGALPEVREEDVLGSDDSTVAPLDLPAVLNGQIMPGDVDRFRLRARKGQQLVVRMQARQLIPYLADAVPGWFQSAMSLYDPNGDEVAYGDDYRFDPDPVLCCTVPEDGIYRLEVRDALYRGRDDFVYRVAVGELPFITELTPLGGPSGVPTVASIIGWNLPTDKLPLDTQPGGPAYRQVTFGRDRGLVSEIPYAVGSRPEVTETEPNQAARSAQAVGLPVLINGRIERPGDEDTFRFEGKAGDEVVAEVCARRLNSPLDSALRLLGPTGAVVAFSDDFDDPEAGLYTHQADSYLRAALPEDGAYEVWLADAQGRGGSAYAYRLRLGAPEPDFAVRVTPSGINVRPGQSGPVALRAVRRDGFDGAIEVILTDGPPGFTLNGAQIPAGKDSVEATLTAPRGAGRQASAIRLQAQATVNGALVTRPVVPAEDMMQAFAYRHLVPQQELLVAVSGSRPVPAVWRPLAAGFQSVAGAPVEIPVGGTAEVTVRAPQTLPNLLRTPLPALRFRLCVPPRGVTLREAAVTATGVTLVVKADTYLAREGDAANLIVEAFAEAGGEAPPAGQPVGRRQRVSLGVLPAIPCRIVRS
jgi:hypothetical protein